MKPYFRPSEPSWIAGRAKLCRLDLHGVRKLTIGRIEVRAITPPPMPPAQGSTPARPGPELSLDDYLKQHNGGQR